jgi:hypothetical protein
MVMNVSAVAAALAVDDTIYVYPHVVAAGQALDGMAPSVSDPTWV